MPKRMQRGKKQYRQIAFEYLEPTCSICGYSDTRVLEVHHKDGDRSNNLLTNLDILCPTHHTEYDLGIRTYNKEEAPCEKSTTDLPFS
jgi:5-methylcytosine-specific restriction endonuclease McrA